MNNEELKEYTLDRISQEGVWERLKEYGEPIFTVVTGAHNFGFPSHNSDIDIRGVYVAPTDRMLGLRRRANEPVFDYFSDDRELDVTIEELGKYLELLCKSNGDRLEWINSDFLLSSGPDFYSLKNTVEKAGVSKKLLNYYLHFGQNVWNGETNADGIKRDLYTLRIYMTGIKLLEEGVVDSNLPRLNQKFGFSVVDELITLKEKDEKRGSEGYSRERVAEVVEGLDERIQRSVERSTLPDEPDKDWINEYLIGLRRSKMGAA